MITTFYILVLIRLHHIRRKHQSELKQRSHRKVTRVVLAVITAYFICWVPYWFLQIFITIDPLIHSLRLNFSILPVNTSMRFLKELTHLTTIIGYANNCLNPVLYVFLSDSFREEYLLVLNCFHLTQMNNNENIQQISVKRERKSFILRKQREIAMKKVKHSVAIEDIPLEYRTFSFRLHHSKDKSRFSTLSMPTQINKNDEINLEDLSIHQQKSLTNNHSSANKLTIQISTSFPDDGGVYCGD
jgi:hypothetical protein